jgi:glutamate synthase (NADPH/NADH) small chain
VWRTSSAHEEGGEREFAVSTTGFSGDDDGHVRLLHAERVAPADGGGLAAVPGSAFALPADLVLLAMGFTGPRKSRLLEDLGIALTPRGTVGRDAGWRTNVAGVYTAGDMQRGQSLVVWAIADGRQAAAAIDADLRRD